MEIMPDPAQRPWEPLSPNEAGSLFATAGFPWWLAGGHAIEMAVGRSLRTHGDIDILVLRRDQDAVRHLLGDWECWFAEPSTSFRFWKKGEAVPPGMHDIWCRKEAAGPWRFQIMLDESEGESWHSRRDHRIHLPIVEMRFPAAPISCLVPEVVLYYKAKNPRVQDELDFRAAIPILTDASLTWLRHALATTYPAHPWLSLLETAGEQRGLV